MARKAAINKCKRVPKFSTRKVIRCELCGRDRGNYRKFHLCRICFRKCEEATTRCGQGCGRSSCRAG